jgi:hypothetical protein
MRIPAYSLIGVLALASGIDARAQMTMDLASESGLSSSLLYASSGSSLLNGNKVAIGYFDTGFDVGANAGNLANLASAWNEITSTVVSLFEPGKFFGSPATISNPALTGTKAYLFAWQTPGNSAPSDNVTGVTAYGLFSANSWTISGTSSPTSPQVLYSFDVTELLHGSRYPESSSGPGLMLSPVPEPHEYAAVAGLGLAAFAAWRRWQGRRAESTSNL